MSGKLNKCEKKIREILIKREFNSMKNVINLKDSEKWNLAKKIVDDIIKER
jgi:hypothetical protein